VLSENALRKGTGRALPIGASHQEGNIRRLF
jgi:hypothetical protein